MRGVLTITGILDMLQGHRRQQEAAPGAGVRRGVPVAAALSFASSAGHRNGTQGGLFGASPYSALNHAMASLEFIGPFLLPIVIALLALAAAIGFVVIASILNGQGALHTLAVILPVHYWQNWITLFDPTGTASLSPGAAVQVATILLCVLTCAGILRRRDPAA